VSDVLVVDDAPDIRLLARLLLERGGHEVSEAGTAEEALRVMAEDRPAVILLDIQLPGISGWDLLQDLRTKEWLSRTQVVLFSAHVDPREFRRAEREGASGYLTKPFTAEQLLDSVRRAIG
jgi:CheY-like chemotaxis protein